MDHPSSETSLTDDRPLFFTDRSSANEVARLLDRSGQVLKARREKKPAPRAKSVPSAPSAIAGSHLPRLAGVFPPLKENTK
jgi:hypothetical protein